MQRSVRVVAALLAVDDAAPLRYLVQQRLAHKARGGLWEFPGGKVEEGESNEAALARECVEELGVVVDVGGFVWSTNHAYDDLTVHLTLYRAQVRRGTPAPLGAQALKLCTPTEMLDLPFCEADKPLIEALAAGRLVPK